MDGSMVLETDCYWNMGLVEGSGQWRNSYGEKHLSNPNLGTYRLLGIGRTL